jgi:5-(carboxyamino)imidazole ribonucleotide synthase
MRVGVIGGGQLALMMAEVAPKLGIELWIQTPNPRDPAVAVAAEVILAPLHDWRATQKLADPVKDQGSVITFENEFVDLQALQPLAEAGIRFAPSLGSLRPLLDKLHQRQLLQSLDLGVPQFWPVADPWDLPYAPSPARPLVLKMRRGGYDGQGTFVVKSTEAAQTQLAQIQHSQIQPEMAPAFETLLLAEEWIPFEQELAIMAARSEAGEIRLFPMVETQQVDQVCRRVLAPAQISPGIQAQIEQIAITLLNHLNWIGILGIELFLTADQRVLVNEIAPRTHNSGHFSLEACLTSQFEQHLRAITGLPLGDPALKGPAAVMVNLLGTEVGSSDLYAPRLAAIARIPNAHLHWYGKPESRPGRKLGHVTVLDSSDPQVPGSRQRLLALARQVEELWGF